MKKITIPIKSFAALALAAVFATTAFAQNQKDSLVTAPASSPNNDEIMKRKIELSKTGENHKLLAGLTGKWTFTGRQLTPDPNVKPEVYGTAERKAVMDGRYFVFETTGGKLIMPWSDGKEVTYRDIAIEGYDNEKKKFFSSRAANHWSTGLTTSEGSYDPATKTITYEREIERGGKKMMVHERLKIINNDHYLFEIYSISDGRETKRMEASYTRVSR